MWVARDKDGELSLYTHKPHRSNVPGWNHESWDIVCGEKEFCDFLDLDPTLFPDLTWDDEPIEVEIVRKK